MTQYMTAIGNGVRTDHPIQDLPFVDDGHLPILDGPALERVGRQRGTGLWGRYDDCRDGDTDTGWAAFTTDPVRHDLGWVVRWHPEHGRSVVLYRNEDVAGVQSRYVSHGAALLHRAGGYWWDGATWFRPSQLWDGAREKYIRRPVPAAHTVTAVDLLQTRPQVPAGQRLDPLKVQDVDLEQLAAGSATGWLQQLALWSQQRPDIGVPARVGCVVNLSAPELGGDQLVAVAELAEIAGVAASTLRAYISRQEGDVPEPQATVHNRSVWSRAVAQEYAERRRHTAQSAAEAVSTNRIESVPTHPGIADVWERFTQMFYARLWDNPARRKQWALRWRTPAAVHDVALDLAWSVAASVKTIVPMGDLSATIRHAWLDDIAAMKALRASTTRSPGGPGELDWYGISLQLARMLDWLIRHDPVTATTTIRELIGDAEKPRYAIPRPVTEKTIRMALVQDTKLTGDQLDDFLASAFGPAQT